MRRPINAQTRLRVRDSLITPQQTYTRSRCNAFRRKDEQIEMGTMINNQEPVYVRGGILEYERRMNLAEFVSALSPCISPEAGYVVPA
jgi:hypothetical protein